MPRIILAQPIKAYLGVACENSRLSAKRLGRLFSQFGAGRPGLESCDVSGEGNHSLHDPQRVLCLGSPFFIDYVVNFRAQYTVIKSAL